MIPAKTLSAALPPTFYQLESLRKRRQGIDIQNQSTNEVIIRGDEVKVSLLSEKNRNAKYKHYHDRFNFFAVPEAMLSKGFDSKYALYTKGRPMFAFLDNGICFLTKPLFDRLSNNALLQLIIHLETVEIGMADANLLNISRDEFQEMLNRLVVLNSLEPGYGITKKQKAYFLERFVGGDLNSLFNELDIAPNLSQHVKFNALDTIGNLRENDFNADVFRGKKSELDRAIEALFAMDSRPQKTVKVTFISFGSPWHYALWNNLSIETLAGDLIGEYGEQVDIKIERCVHDPEIDEVLGRLKQDAPDIIALSMEVGTLPGVDRFLKAYSAFEWPPRQVLAMGNQVATYFPEKFIEDPRCTKAIIGLHEGELVMRGLVEYFMGRCSIREIGNLVYRDAETGKVLRTPLKNIPLNELPHPPSMHTVKHGITNMIQTSRGCVFGCSYCTRWLSFNSSQKIDAEGEITEPNASTKWRGFDLTRVFQNIERFAAAGINEIEFCDDEFFGGYSKARLSRVNDFAEGMMKIQDKYDIKISYRLFTTPLIIARERESDKAKEQNAHIKSLLQKLQKTGLVQVYIGLESGSIAQKKRYDRRETIDDTTAALQVLRDLNLKIDVGFIMFDPELTVQEMLENVEYFKQYGLVKHNTWPFRPLVVNEGTTIKSRLEAKGLLTGSQEANFLAYDYKYADPVVGRIADAVQTIAKETAIIFYTCKNISKTHWKANPTLRTTRSLYFIEENADIYLDLMKALGENVGKDKREQILEEEILDSARRRLLKLVNEVKKEVSPGGVFMEFEEDRKILTRLIADFDEQYGEIYRRASECPPEVKKMLSSLGANGKHQKNGHPHPVPKEYPRTEML